MNDANYYQPFPGGTDAGSYRLAFRVWMVFFLLVICFGLLNFIGTKMGY